MVPRPLPVNSSGYWKIYEVVTTGLTQWVDYIPVIDKGGTAASPDRWGTSSDGAFRAEVLGSNAGLTAWVDYTPVDFVSTGGEGRTDANGSIPVWTP